MINKEEKLETWAVFSKEKNTVNPKTRQESSLNPKL
jgi:hypothetical protein